MARLEVVGGGERELTEAQKSTVPERRFDSTAVQFTRMKARRIRKEGGSEPYVPAFDEGKCGI
jgi:hypothetical protein